jgi:hypothetical protein
VVKTGFLEANVFVRRVHMRDGLDLDDGLAGFFRSEPLIFGQNCRGRDATDGKGDCS